MVQLLDGRVVSRPIAGTRRRGATEEEDRRLEAELVEHPKELAEHVMLVDLARNDVGRVVRFGTERVDELMTVERYSHVMHLTSRGLRRARRGPGPDRRAAGDAARRHGLGRAEGAGHGDHRRARADQARPVRRRRRLHRLLGQPRHRDRDPHARRRPPTAGPRCRPVPASSPTAIRSPRTRSARPRPRRCWPRSPVPASWRPRDVGRRDAAAPSTSSASYELLREEVCASRTARDVVLVRGPDARDPGSRAS